MIDWTKFDYFVKALSFIAGGILIAIAILSWVFLTVDPVVIASRIAFVILGLKIILSNFELDFMKNNFPYMYIYFWNGLFIIGCGSLLIETSFSLYLILGIVMMGLGLAVIICGFVRPKKRDYVNS